MITEGKLPFAGNSVSEYEKLHKKGRITSVSSPLFPIISKSLEKKPNRRFQDFAPIREELQKILFKETGETMQRVLEMAVQEYHKAFFWGKTNSAFAALKADESAWDEELTEREEWDVTLSDGLETNADD